MVRLIVKEFHEQMEDLLKNFPNSYSKHNFAKELDHFAYQLKQEHRLSDHINTIRKSLKGVRNAMVKVSKKSLVAGRVNKELFFNNYYGGIILDSRSVNQQHYDKVIEFEPDNTIAWTFSASTNDQINHAQIRSEVEQDYNKKCTYVIEKYPANAKDVPTKDFESNTEPIEVEDVPPENNSNDTTPTVSADGWVENATQIGRVEFDKKNPLKLPEDRKKWYFTIIIKDEFVNEIWPNAKVAVYGQFKSDRTPIGFERVTFFAELGDGGKYRSHGKKGNFGSWTELHTEYRAHPISQKLSDTKLGEFTNSDLTGFKVRKLTEDETLLLNGMRNGIAYGYAITDETRTTARYPYDANDPVLDKTPYQSKHFLGRMNSGKTTAIKWDFLTTATSPEIPEDERPIFIFIDGQGNFTHFPRIENLNDEAREYCETHGITNPRLDVYTFSNNPNRGDTTLGLDQLPVPSWIYTMAEASANTEGTLINELGMARETLIRQGSEVNIQTIRLEMENRINGNHQINYNIRNAIGRVLTAPETNLFDQENREVLTPEMLFQRGRSLTLDVSNLNFNDRRSILAYVMEMLHHHKFVMGRKFPHVILVLDEIESLVPHNGTQREKYNISRLSKRLEEITFNGRQNYYGIYFVTHRTSKVSPDLITLANTHCCFKPSADDSKFLKEYLPEVPLDKALNLSTGEFYMKVLISTDDQPEIIAKCKFPSLSEVEDNPL